MRVSKLKWLRGWAIGLVGLAALALVLFWQFKPASAAQVLARANQTWSALPQAGEIIYQNFELMINVGPVNYAARVAVWRSSDGAQVRYQMTDAQGRLIYFMLRRDDQVWRSGSLLTLSLTPVTSLVPANLAQYQQALAAEQGSARMLLLAAGIDRPGITCLDLKCFLGDWSAGNGVTLVRQKDAATASGLLGPAVSLSFAGDPPTSRCILVMDPQTGLLAEYVDPQGNMLHVLEYRSLPPDQLPPDLFTSFPAGVNTVSFRSAPVMLPSIYTV